MQKALGAMGGDVQERPDGLVIRKSSLHGARIDSRSDHRMVMTMAVAAMVASGQTLITDVDCVKKTFPDFVSQMRCVEADMQTQKR